MKIMLGIGRRFLQLKEGVPDSHFVGLAKHAGSPLAGGWGFTFTGA